MHDLFLFVSVWLYALRDSLDFPMREYLFLIHVDVAVWILALLTLCNVRSCDFAHDFAFEGQVLVGNRLAASDF